MKLSLRWQLLLAAIGLSLVLSLLSFQVQSGGLCTTRVPAAGGDYVEGIVGAPRALNPLLSDPYVVDQEIVDLLFDGLTQYDANGRLVPALAEQWQVGEDGRSLRFTLRENITWHDGEPVTAADVAFTYRLMQDEAFPGPAGLRQLWQTVTINVIDSRTVEFVLAEPYAPFLDTTTRGILPAHRLEGVTAADLAAHPFNDSPIGTGPFMVAEDQDWRQSGQLRLLPNPMFWRQGTQLDALTFRFFPDEATLLEAFTAGEIHALNRVPPAQLPVLADEPQIRLFTAPKSRVTTLFFNTDRDTGALTADLGVRRGLAYGLDRDQIIDSELNGQGLRLNGPYLPSSWAYNPDVLSMYATNPLSATAALEQDGWGVPAGEPIRRKEETALVLDLVTLARNRSLATAVAAQWRDIGVGTEIRVLSDIGALRDVLDAGEFDVALVEVQPPADPDLYDFWSQEAIISGQNYTAWNSRRASEALETARQIWRVEERRPYYDTFLRLFSAEVPALTLYQHVYTYAVRDDVNRLDIGLIQRPRDRYQSFSIWFIQYRDVTVNCVPDESSG